MINIEKIKKALAMTNTMQSGDTDIFPNPYKYDVLEYQSE
jgi:hypothetical protein